MSNIETGGPAFPVTLLEGQTLGDGTANGMTLRDYFAAKVIQGALTNDNFANGFDFSEKAAWAYQQADAMLEARK